MDYRNAALKFVAEFPMQAPMTYLLNEDYFSDVIPLPVAMSNCSVL